MKRTLLLLAVPVAVAAMVLAFSSCSKDRGDGDNFPDEDELTDPIVASDEKIDLPAAIVGQMPGYLKSALDIRFTNVTGQISDDLDVVVVADDRIAPNTDELVGFYRAGGTIVVVNPDDATLEAWCEENGIGYAGDAGYDGGDDDHLLYAFNKNANYYFLDDFIHDDDEGSCNIVLDSFVSWVNKYAVPGDMRRPGLSALATRAGGDYDIKKQFKPQTVNHTYQMCLNNKTLAHAVASKADKLTRSGTIDVAYSIYPLYSFRENGNSAGDYYIVEGRFTVHNKQMYNGSWTKKHGGVKARLCGFYLKKFEVTNTLCDTKGVTVSGVEFPTYGSPVPANVIDKTSYSSGFQWGLGGSVSGGMLGSDPQFSGMFNGSMGWNNSETRSVSDLTISQDSPDGKVGYVFDINNRPHTSGGKKHTSVPSIASSDFTIHLSWIWYVPSTVDNDTKEFAMTVWVKPTYEAYHWYSSAADFSTSSWDDAVPETDRKLLVTLLKPNRIPKGMLEIRNTSTELKYMAEIKIWKESSGTSKDPDYTIPGSFYNGEAASVELPVGRYKVQVILGSSKDVLKVYHSTRAIEVELARTTAADAWFEFEPGTL